MTHPPYITELYRRRLAVAGIPMKYRHLRLADWQPYNDLAAKAYTAAVNFVATVPERLAVEPMDEPAGPLIGRGLALIGPWGGGKTTLACATASEIHIQHNPAIFFVAMADYIAVLAEQHSIKPQADRGVPEAVERYWKIHELKQRVYKSPLVVFDDVGKEHRTASNMAVDEVDRLLRQRFRNGLLNVVTSNEPLERWSKLYNPSMASFASEAFDEVVLGGKDLRRGC
ncbi:MULTISPECIES: ATP-binding protein [Streptosporangium]|uniref:DNA replication protein DnaC n=1 Tax=Streptosporangium brasiliense TaxID=47480 RepID=A0ABT9RMD7_9ACTN|nr:ATP-binding protein [Streptosporangium brasiliense]MDP9870451.1 DNA replication protein DnaC [Streptosporangium brasiliense]